MECVLDQLLQWLCMAEHQELLVDFLFPSRHHVQDIHPMALLRVHQTNDQSHQVH